MNRIFKLYNKKEKIVAGVMSGTSVDGIDIAITKINGSSLNTKVELLAFENIKYTQDIRDSIFKLFEHKTSSSEDVCYMNFFLGNLYADCIIDTMKKYNIPQSSLDLIGSHGQTIFHIPKSIYRHNYSIKSTLQIGEGAVIAHKTQAVTVSDFRVADMAAMGEGAPLVPYVDYLLFNKTNKTIALQNIGGIGNVTVIKPNSREEDIIAFDTGPGNVVIDYVTNHVTSGDLSYDVDGKIGAKGTPCNHIVDELLIHPYFRTPPPKTTGRELFDVAFCQQFIEKCKQNNLSNNDMVATATYFTAKSIFFSYENFVKTPIDMLVVSGGGSYNITLLNMLTSLFTGTQVLTQEDIGYSSDAKEAIAFAILANETISLNGSNIPCVTGAHCKKILGKISLC